MNSRGPVDTMFLGLDIGSVSVNTVLLDPGGRVVEEQYTRIGGQPYLTAEGVLRKILTGVSVDQISRVAVTGSGGKLLAQLLGGIFVNEVIAQARAVERFYPQARTIIDIGGEDSKLILLRFDPASGKMLIEDFAMNTICAAGTGSFLEQQAARLGLAIEEEFGSLALKSEHPPRIAGRCSVFAKTDMIHLQQEAAPVYDIVAGLCYALARSFKGNLGQGKTIRSPVVFQGGVAANRGMVQAFADILELKKGELIVPEHYASMGAIGAVFAGEHGRKKGSFQGLQNLENYLKGKRFSQKSRPPLLTVDSDPDKETGPVLRPDREGRPREVYLGIDVGSISTKVVAIDEQGSLLVRKYLLTSGRPLEAVRLGVAETGKKLGEGVLISGVGTTGSGRYLIGDFVGADVIKNEITAQARAAVAIDPAVDTIFEIGGQDSKFVSLDGGVVVDFEMNKVCAAGTGSFLEEQAERLEIDVEEEFGNLALRAKTPVDLGERCTVFMQSNLVAYQQQGASRADLVAGLAYSIVENYLNRVVGKKKIGNNIFFQGAVALNQAVVAAFQQILEKRITVPLHCDVTGAIGVALCAREARKNNSRPSRFKGFSAVADSRYQLRSFDCPDCPNHCKIREVLVNNEKPLFYGSRCEKYNVDRNRVESAGLPNLFAEREKFLLNSYTCLSGGRRNLPRVGIPRALIFHEMFPFWKAFFSELGFEVVFSGRTTNDTIRRGGDHVATECCFPIKVTHGHVLELMEKEVDYLFLPSIINQAQFTGTSEQSFNCPCVQSLPQFVRSAFSPEEKEIQVISPVLAFGWNGRLAKRLLRRLGRDLKRREKDIERAISSAEAAQRHFQAELRRRGEQILANLPGTRKTIVIVSRPYNGCDPGINLDLGRKLRRLGALPLPMDFLPLASVDISGEYPDMYWNYGQKILAAAEIIRRRPQLHALYLTNFSCGPDSFITHFFREKMGSKPYLQIEIDEHTSEVGALTRCEAFLDSLDNVRSKRTFLRAGKPPQPFSAEKKKRKVYIPRMSSHAFVLQAGFQSNGIEAEVLPESDEETLKWGRKFTDGRECYPCIVTTGDMVKIVMRPDFDRQRSAFFMPSTNGPCRFGQYHKFQRMVLDELGYPDVPIIAPNQGEDMYRYLGLHRTRFPRQCWQGVLAIDFLDKLRYRIRPYERESGETDRVYQESRERVCEALASGDDLREVLKAGGRAFHNIKVEREGERPKIGIVGEIFVRSNEFSNEYLVSRVEQLGGEVIMPPISEWLYHVTEVNKIYTRIQRKYIAHLLLHFRSFIQRCDDRRLSRPMEELFGREAEPDIIEIWQRAEKYIPSWFGETALSLGKAVSYSSHGAAGIINVMPFTCMTGIITAACLKTFRGEHQNIPCLNLAFDGQEQTNIDTRLETFICQAGEYRKQTKFSCVPAE